jgi:hypothetical protein
MPVSSFNSLLLLNDRIARHATGVIVDFFLVNRSRQRFFFYFLFPSSAGAQDFFSSFSGHGESRRIEVAQAGELW